MAVKQPLTTEDTLTMCNCWLITRQDSQTYAFTDANKEVTVSSVTYKPIGAIASSAKEVRIGFEPGTSEFTGIIDGTLITFDDISKDLFTDATLDERLVNWSNSNVYVHRKYIITNIQWDNDTWTAQTEDIKHLLKRRVGRAYTRSCPYVLGDSRCGVDLPNHAHTQSLSVDGVTDQFVFTIGNLGTIFTGNVDPSDVYPLGKVKFTSGNNIGLTYEIVSVAGSSPWAITLREKAYSTIQVGDNVTISPGCDGTTSTCKSVDRYNNFNNYGGFPNIPGIDQVNRPGQER